MISADPCSSFTVTHQSGRYSTRTATESEPTISFSFSISQSQSQSQHPQATAANSNGSSNTSTNTNANNNRPTYFPIWLRLSRLIFGKIRRLPRSMSTTLVLFTVHMYLTVPVLVVCGITSDLKALLRPFRYIKEQGFLFEELGEQFCELL
uniref:Uncharacterized protein n=1 Tax=Panagrolaimus sp. PS1159 TaxID=55785 RepID=A0AC35F1X0_9BILA